MDEKIVLFGAGERIGRYIKFIEQYGGFQVLEIWDNDSRLCGTRIKINGAEIEVRKPYGLQAYKIVISSEIYFEEIRRQLTEQFGIDDKRIKAGNYLLKSFRGTIVDRYKDSKDKSIQQICAYLQGHDLDMFNGQVRQRYNGDTFDISFDEEKGLLYSAWMGKRIYLSSDIKSEKAAKAYLCGLCREQDDDSPHSYQIPKLNLSRRDVVIDGGAAEGFFSLQIIDKVKKIYLVEGDPNWLEALRHTFEPYKDKTIIIPKWLGDSENERTTTIDGINKECNVTAVKLDIEGGEGKALIGGEKTFSGKGKMKVILCTYHRTEDAENFYNYFREKGYMAEFSKGYLFADGIEFLKPELRKGVLTAVKDQESYMLSVCIPNYNRIGQLEMLLRETAGQILSDHLENKVEICVSDDCSEEEPRDVIRKIKEEFQKIAIKYERSETNKGMDYNFLNSVEMAEGAYAWIIGNDDMPEKKALSRILEIIEETENGSVDLIVTPFDSYDSSQNFVKTVYPLGKETAEAILFDTRDKQQLHYLITKVKDNAALFGFLSNVVFKRERWIKHGNMFEDKMTSIFIQVYMNLQTLTEGARYLYWPQKIIVNFLDDEINQTMDRTYKIAAGLYDAMDYFFQGELRAAVEESVVDIFLAAKLLELPEWDERKVKVNGFVSRRMDVLKLYYVKDKDRKGYFQDKRVIVYGAGKFGHMALSELAGYRTDIIGICDKDEKKQGGCLEGKTIFDFNTLLGEYERYENCEVVVANNEDLVQIIHKLAEHGVTRIAIIT